MGKIILVRHGETDWNTTDRIQGWRDIPLNSEGEKQADKTARELSTLRIDAVYSSPLKRAFRTAEKIAAKHGLKVLTVEEFKEVSQGVWEGYPVSQARARFPSVYAKWLETPAEHGPPGGETAEDVRKRAVRALSEIKRAHSDGQTICIVAHKVVIAVIKCVHGNINLNSIHSLLPGNAAWEIINENFNSAL